MDGRAGVGSGGVLAPGMAWLHARQQVPVALAAVPNAWPWTAGPGLDRAV